MRMVGDRVQRLRVQATAYGLLGHNRFWVYSRNELATIYNGLGPDFFPEELRVALTKLHPDLECVLIIHDVQFYESDGSVDGFEKANATLVKNGLLVADLKYSVIDPRRYIRRFQARALGKMCSLFGWTVWSRCAAKRKTVRGE